MQPSIGAEPIRRWAMKVNRARVVVVAVIRCRNLGTTLGYISTVGTKSNLHLKHDDEGWPLEWLKQEVDTDLGEALQMFSFSFWCWCFVVVIRHDYDFYWYHHVQLWTLKMHTKTFRAQSTGARHVANQQSFRKLAREIVGAWWMVVVEWSAHMS